MLPEIPNCYAHSLPGLPRESWQRLDNHLAEVAGSARQFAEAFVSGDWAWNAGWMHDVGKAAEEFQAHYCQSRGALTERTQGGARQRQWVRCKARNNFVFVS